MVFLKISTHQFTPTRQQGPQRLVQLPADWETTIDVDGKVFHVAFTDYVTRVPEDVAAVMAEVPHYSVIDKSRLPRKWKPRKPPCVEVVSDAEAEPESVEPEDQAVVEPEEDGPPGLSTESALVGPGEGDKK
ncbi:MAG: hypothetical protein KAW17_09780 [Candidatus Eisenbacteria sp.]|nr:hypothetical protein [Candidatus Eisenbacteria bacterium]